MKFRNAFFALATIGLILAGGSTASALTINLSFDPDQTYTTAGVTDVAAMKAACTYAANQFTSRYSDPITVNIKVTASAGTSDFGSSTASLDSVSSYNNLRAAFAGDSKTPDDATTISNGGSLPSGADPIATNHLYLVSRAQAKALGIRADDQQNDGTFNFGQVVLLVRRAERVERVGRRSGPVLKIAPVVAVVECDQEGRPVIKREESPRPVVQTPRPGAGIME